MFISKWPNFAQYTRTYQAAKRYPLEFDVLRRKAEARVVMGGAFPDTECGPFSGRKIALTGQRPGLPELPYCGEAGAPTV